MNKDVTRLNENFQKRTRSLMTINVGPSQLKDYQDATNNYLVGYLPADALITQAYVFTGVASDAGALTLGTSEGGTEILSAGDTATPGQSGTFTGRTQTGTGKEVHMTLGAAATTGAFVVFIEYSEYLLNTGELTRIS